MDALDAKIYYEFGKMIGMYFVKRKLIYMWTKISILDLEGAKLMQKLMQIPS